MSYVNAQAIARRRNPGRACRCRPRGVVPRTALRRARLDATITMIEHIVLENDTYLTNVRCSTYDEWANGTHGGVDPGGTNRPPNIGSSVSRLYRFSGFRKIVMYRLKIGRPTGRGAVTSQTRRSMIGKIEDGNTNFKTSPCSGLSIFPGRRKRTEKVLWTTQFVSQILQIRHTPLIVDLAHAYLIVQRHRRMKRT
jgi:hypothetical protein